MHAERFEVLLRNESTGQTVKRAWTTPELLKGVQWLKRMNAKGSDVYIRPAGQHGVILIDGLQAENIAAMSQKGFEPAVTVETRPGVFQAWVVLSKEPCPVPVLRTAAAGIAKAFFGIHSELASDGYGRLAGFTAHDEECCSKGKRRFVLAHERTEVEASNGLKYLQHIEAALWDQSSARKRSPSNERSLAKHLGRAR